MFGRIRASLGRFDWPLFAGAVFLAMIGIAAIWSVALARDVPELITVKKQAAALILGLAAIFLLAAANFRLLKNYAVVIFGIAVIALFAVLFAGVTVRGTTGWFSVFGWNFQPVEFAKLALIIFLAKFLADHPRAAFRLREFLLSSAAAGAAVFLVLLQPDLGSAIVLIAVWLGLLAFARIRPRYFIAIIAGAVIAALLAWTFFLADYQKDRVSTFFNPDRDPFGSGYNVRQAIIAVGAGNLFGRGLGFGSQSQLRFLPESHTDFIFAVIAEELGFLGVTLVLGAFAMVFGRLYRMIETARDDFTGYLLIGILITLLAQFAINIGMNLGLVPVTGIALPFLSYGGSSLLIFLIMVGLAESIASRRVLGARPLTS